jgi:hypothetical protein
MTTYQEAIKAELIHGDSIMEQGENGSGEYIKLLSGTIIMRGNSSIPFNKASNEVEEKKDLIGSW